MILYERKGDTCPGTKPYSVQDLELDAKGRLSIGHEIILPERQLRYKIELQEEDIEPEFRCEFEILSGEVFDIIISACKLIEWKTVSHIQTKLHDVGKDECRGKQYKHQNNNKFLLH